MQSVAHAMPHNWLSACISGDEKAGEDTFTCTICNSMIVVKIKQKSILSEASADRQSWPNMFAAADDITYVLNAQISLLPSPSIGTRTY